MASGKYAYAVGRRKTSVANIRLFNGKGKNTVNQKDIAVYFGNKALVEQALKPLQLTGLENHAYVYINISGGGINSQSQAVAHGIATAMAKSTPELRKVLKKNGLLTRDSRMKERKKPGLKRARRGPQWAKR
ncbi:30S ribosomal protein S9 [Patescibacteria group bacterium]|nr:30S ribosomal protein S9 [Patescibacteria group bacterium]